MTKQTAQSKRHRKKKKNSYKYMTYIAFVFIVKDGEEYLSKNLNKIKELNINKDIYAVENNSKDNTKEILQQSNLTKVIHLDLNDNQHSTQLCATSEAYNCPKRVRRLAYLRQQGLEAIMNSGIEYDYVCMLDLDFHSFDSQKLHEMFTYMENNIEVDGMFGMSNARIDHFFGTTHLPYDTSAVEPLGALAQIIFGSQRYVDVKSAFSGFGIYRCSSLKNTKYEYDTITDIEHKAFNSQFKKLVVDTHFTPVYGHVSDMLDKVRIMKDLMLRYGVFIVLFIVLVTVCTKIMSSLMRGDTLAHWNLHGPRR